MIVEISGEQYLNEFAETLIDSSNQYSPLEKGTLALRTP